MAYSVPASDILTAINIARTQVRENVSRGVEFLRERERVLLSYLQCLEEAYIEDRARRDFELQELLISREQNLEILKCNKHENTLKYILQDLDDRITELDVNNEQLHLEWDCKLESRIHSAGRFVLNGGRTMSYHYKSKRTPVQVFGRHNQDRSQVMEQEFLYPNAIAIDPLTNFIYVCDTGRNRIQVFDRTSQFLFKFSELMSTPFGICIHANRVYVTQMMSNIITVYGVGGKLIASTEKGEGNNFQLSSPKGITVCKITGYIYVCDYTNKRIIILNQELCYQSSIQCDSFPDDIKLTELEIFLLECADPCISIYKRHGIHSHQLVGRVIPYGMGKLVLESFNFFLDHEENILITDTKSHNVLVFSRRGSLIHTFGTFGQAAGEFICPKGICVDSEGRILVASQNPNYCIQFF
ncbi:PEP-CTERM domain protein [Oopsacas minuta]|uniref:PEP-CTERM domain protein n=1 Tax=Oopsacas minuta TaxID=111878 RepID=A0AAV7JCY4_9METZ|nr:PEP-CTERM domain protein [Oopsacas minuta]